MKTIKFISLLLLTMGIMVCCEKETVEPTETKDISLSDNYKDVFLKRKGHWGPSNNRIDIYSSSLDNTFFENASLTVRFKNEIEKLTLYIYDSNNQVIFEDEILARKNSSYNIPISFSQGEEYLIEVTSKTESYYLNFTIQ